MQNLNGLKHGTGLTFPDLEVNISRHDIVYHDQRIQKIENDRHVEAGKNSVSCGVGVLEIHSCHINPPNAWVNLVSIRTIQ